MAAGLAERSDIVGSLRRIGSRGWAAYRPPAFAPRVEREAQAG